MILQSQNINISSNALIIFWFLQGLNYVQSQQRDQARMMFTIIVIWLLRTQFLLFVLVFLWHLLAIITGYNQMVLQFLGLVVGTTDLLMNLQREFRLKNCVYCEVESCLKPCHLAPLPLSFYFFSGWHFPPLFLKFQQSKNVKIFYSNEEVMLLASLVRSELENVAPLNKG